MDWLPVYKKSGRCIRLLHEDLVSLFQQYSMAFFHTGTTPTVIYVSVLLLSPFGERLMSHFATHLIIFCVRYTGRKYGIRNGVMDKSPDCCTIRGAIAGFESLAKHWVDLYIIITYTP